MDRLKALTSRARAAPPDVVSGGFLLVVAVAYGFVALRIPRGDGEPGPGAMPLALALLLAGLSIWILAHGLRTASDPGSDEEETELVAGPGAERMHGGRAWLAASATVAYVALFQPLGFMVSTLAYTAALAWLFGRSRHTLVAVSVGVTDALFVFYRLAHRVRLPHGPFG